MGVVYRALDTRNGQLVAVKVLAPKHVEDEGRRRRFLREARVAAAVVDPMELVQGDTLRARLARGRMPLAEALHFALAIARGVAQAHEKGIVHCDLKPENVIVTEGRDVKVLDFGLAKLHEKEGSLVYDEETVSATPRERIPVIFDVARGTHRPLSPKLGSGRYGALRFSPDGRRVVLTRGTNRIVEVDVASGAIVREIDAGNDLVQQLFYIGQEILVIRSQFVGDILVADLL
jgi:serine/threonine protein kinase